MTDAQQIPVIVLGGTGYVAGELLRLIAGHPQLMLAAAVSESKAGEVINSVFPNLQNSFGEQRYIELSAIGEYLNGEVALFSAAPHGASAKLIADVLEQADKQNCDITVVDASADFRYPAAAQWEAVYGMPHGAPDLIDQFASALPEHIENPVQPHVGHPGCFTTAMLLGIVPLLKLGLTEADISAFGITGSTGSGREPIETTHHPFRQSNLYAYKPLAHRHAPEVTGIAAALTGVDTALHFVPHSGPFARGIHMTLQAKLTQPSSTEELQEQLRSFYAGKTFVKVTHSAPRIKDVAGSNYAHISAAADNTTAAVFVAIDNLVKGAAGGAMQWMNIKLGLDETAGLTAPGPGWT